MNKLLIGAFVATLLHSHARAAEYVIAIDCPHSQTIVATEGTKADAMAKGAWTFHYLTAAERKACEVNVSLAVTK